MLENKKLSKNINNWQRPILYEWHRERQPKDVHDHKIEKENIDGIDYDLFFFEPEYLAVYPSTSEYFEEEPMWTVPINNNDYVWDFTVSPISEKSDLLTSCKNSQ